MTSRWSLAALMLLGPPWSALAHGQNTLAEQNQRLLLELQQVHGLTDAQMSKIRTIFAGSRGIGQGNPGITRHPMTPEQRRTRVQESGATYGNPTLEPIFGANFVAPPSDPSQEVPHLTNSCI